MSPDRGDGADRDDAGWVPGAAARVASGIPRLDYILQGGLLERGIYTVIGPPGGGKTILANQFCFNHAARYGGNCVYLSLLVESHSKMLRHLESLDFFDPGLIPDRIYYVSGYSALREGGSDALLAMIRATLADRKATLLVIDGLESIRHLGEGERRIKEFIHELQVFTAMIGCTTLLLSLADSGYSSTENAVVDGIIELTDELVGPRAVRELVVHKFRGGGYLRGRHEVEIGGAGMVVHPRTEIQFDHPPARATEERIRMPFGVPELDRMLSGGLPSGSTTALLGAPGTGKTLLGLSFLVEGAKRGQHGTYFGFYEPPPRLREKAAQVGIELGRSIDDGLIDVIWQPPLEHLLDSLAEQLLEQLRGDESPRRRLFIDGIEGFRAATVYADRMPRFLSAFTNQLRMYDVTAVVTEELPLFHHDIDMPNPELANVVESVILLRYVELGSQLHRLMSIMKMRESRYDTSLREFRITDDGLEVAVSFESAEAILSGHARRTVPGPAGREARP
jgi:circadian clock protein KaiC